MTSEPKPAEPADRLERCPGCGGRNPATAHECEWCARPFGTHGGTGRHWWPVVAGILLVLGVVIVLGLAALSLTTPEAATSRPVTPTPAATLQVAAPTATRAAVARRTPLPRSGPAEIAHTEGEGASVRREPSAQSERIEVLPEHAMVRIVGPEVLDDDSAWVEVQTESGQRGWVQSDLVSPLGGSDSAG